MTSDDKANRVAMATVRITLEIDCGAWGVDCTIGQAVKQSKEEAIRRLNAAMKGANLPREIRLTSIETVEVALVPEGGP